VQNTTRKPSRVKKQLWQQARIVDDKAYPIENDCLNANTKYTNGAGPNRLLRRKLT